MANPNRRKGQKSPLYGFEMCWGYLPRLNPFSPIYPRNLPNLDGLAAFLPLTPFVYFFEFSLNSRRTARVGAGVAGKGIVR